ncbi:MAG: F0F1 ATP synthase subunit epsilon [Gammaproteobacteria bacterium]|nr:F0F1 ATP synthase subunit epsilon [Gammaproteobacteria bacterium]
MAMTMHVNIVSAEKQLFSDTAEIVVAPASQGEVGIHPRHTQMLTTLKPGEVRITKQGGEEESIYVSGGILEVQPHVVTILSDTAVRGADLDEAAAMEAMQRAKQALADKTGDMEEAQALAQLAESAAQLRMIEKLRKGKIK